MILGGSRPLVAGYMLVAAASDEDYRGVDRRPFEPEVIEAEVNLDAKEGARNTWELYPPGWRREAYRVYETNLAPGCGERVFLLRSLDSARHIQRLIAPRLGPHEVLFCSVWPLDDIPSLPDDTNLSFLGFDAAYVGGDYYSAVRNGLLVHPHPQLMQQYAHELNKWKLFSVASAMPAYVRRFKDLVPSERDSEFAIYAVSEPKSQ